MEDSLKVITKNYNNSLDALTRAERWVKAVDEAAAKPENVEIIATLRKESNVDGMFRRSWSKIAGAPSPVDFGFVTDETPADKAGRALGYGTKSGIGYFRPYHEYYLKQPHSPGDRPFRFYDHGLLDKFPTWDHYASVEALAKRLPFGHRVFNAVGEHIHGDLVWAHTQNGKEASIYGIYFDIVPGTDAITSPPAGWIGDGSNRFAFS